MTYESAFASGVFDVSWFTGVISSDWMEHLASHGRHGNGRTF